MQFFRSMTAALGALLMLSAMPAFANKLVVPGVRVAVSKSQMMVTPDREWNRLSYRPGKNAELWTLDGDGLNSLTFFGGVPSGVTLFRDVARKVRPLPPFSSTMLLTDIPTLLENSLRITLSTTLISVSSITPAEFAGNKGIRFAYAFTQSDGVCRNGEATATIVKGKLYMITYEAPVIFYFDRNLANYRAVAQSAKIGS